MWPDKVKQADPKPTHELFVRTPAGTMLVVGIDVQIDNDGTDRLGVSVDLVSVVDVVEPPSREAMEVELLEAKLATAKARLAHYSGARG